MLLIKDVSFCHLCLHPPYYCDIYAASLSFVTGPFVLYVPASGEGSEMEGFKAFNWPANFANGYHT